MSNEMNILELIVCDEKGFVGDVYDENETKIGNNLGKICRQMGKKQVEVPKKMRDADPNAPLFVEKYIDNYTFYAVKVISKKAQEPIQVTLSMPLGGQYNGIFRYPRIGERVLTACQGNKYYLLAYLPGKEGDCNDFQFSAGEQVAKIGDSYVVTDVDENTTLCDAEAEVLRYRKNGSFRAKNGNDVNCSEIGFYREISEFPADRNDTELPLKECATTYEYLENSKYKKVNFGPGEEPSEAVKKNINTKVTKYPLIDNLKIQSAGNISTTSQNANEVNAQRILIQSTFLSSENVKNATPILSEDMQLLSDLKSNSEIIAEYNYRTEKGLGGEDKSAKDKAENTNTDNLIKIGSRHNKMVMPNKTSITDIGKGDICLNADGNITLTARNAITLKVGANKITIDKSGVTISTGKGLGILPGPYDGNLSITNEGNVSIGGKSFSANTEEAFTLSDAMGGGVTSSLGSVDVTGVEVGLSTITGANHLYKLGNWLYSKVLELMAKVTNQGRQKTSVSGTGKAYEVLANIQGYAGAIAGTTVGALKKTHHTNSKGEDFSFNNTMMIPLVYNVIWGILSAVKSSLTSHRMAKDSLHYDKDKGLYYSKLHQDDGNGVYVPGSTPAEDKYVAKDIDKINRLYELDLGFTIAQMSMIAMVKTAMIVMQRANLCHFAQFKLGCDASAGLEAKDYYQNTINSEEVVSIAAGLQIASYNQVAGDEKASVTKETDSSTGNDIYKETENKYKQISTAHTTTVIGGHSIKISDGGTGATDWDHAVHSEYVKMFDDHGKVPINWAGVAITGIPTLLVTSVVCGINVGFAQNCIAKEQKEVITELGDL